MHVGSMLRSSRMCKQKETRNERMIEAICFMYDMLAGKNADRSP